MKSFEEKSEKERLEQIRERARAEKLRVARERSIKERERRENEREKHLLDEQLKLIEERAKERKMSITKKHENPDRVRVQQNTQEVKNIVINAVCRKEYSKRFILDSIFTFFKVQKRSHVLDDLNCTALCEELQGQFVYYDYFSGYIMSDDEGDIDCQYMNSQKSISKAPSPHRRLSATIPVKAMSNTSIQFEPNELITSTPLIEKRCVQFRTERTLSIKIFWLKSLSLFSARPTRNKSGLRAETNVILKVPPKRQLSGGRGGKRRGKKK
uniref:Inner centromere protein A n=1 Tax=Heterorhabditis bacteriophora TaxID=37862 RepID=A0A1I7X4L0_HETBA